jgi:uncharacterized protein (TIGR02117 family)
MTFFSLHRAALGLGFFCCLLLLERSELQAAWQCRAQNGSCRSVFVVHNAWHAALVLRKSEIPAKSIPEVRDFPAAEMIEISWGDQDYFPDPDSGVFAALKAAFWSRGSVLHLVGFSGTPGEFYPGAKVVELQLSRDAFARLVAFMAAEFVRAEPAAPAKPRPGLYDYSRFYLARSEFGLARTCNTWVAETLHHAGVPVQPNSVIMARSLAAQLADLHAGQGNQR